MLDPIDEAKQALNDRPDGWHWIVGRCAASWVKPYTSGRTDKAFAQLVGASQPRVSELRRVWIRFRELRHAEHLGMSHFVEALMIDPRQQIAALEKANDEQMGVRQMWGWVEAQRMLRKETPKRRIIVRTKR